MLLPLDEVPVHVPLRRPRPLRFERPGEAPHPAPSARKSVIRLHRKLPSAPPGLSPLGTPTRRHALARLPTPPPPPREPATQPAHKTDPPAPREHPAGLA